jgi:tetratricopeptide (TPR) repeat protein
VATDTDLALRLVAPLATLHGTPTGYAANPWAETVLALPDTPQHPLYPEILAWAGYATAIAGEAERAVSLTHQALQLAAATSSGPRSTCRVLASAFAVAGLAGRFEEAKDITRRWLELGRALRDDYEVALASTFSTTPYFVTGDDAGEAQRLLEEGLTVARRLGNPSAIAYAATWGLSYWMQTNLGRARELLDEALANASSVDNNLALGLAISYSVSLHIEAGAWQEAAEALLRAIEHWYRVGDRAELRLTLTGAVLILTEAGSDQAAALLVGATPRAEFVAHQAPYNEAVIGLRRRLGTDRFTACENRGKQIGYEELVDLLRREVGALVPIDRRL